MICPQSFSILGGLHFSSETGPTSPTHPVFTAQHQVWCRVKVTRYLSPVHLSSLNPAVVFQHRQQQGCPQVMLLTSGDPTIPWFPSEPTRFCVHPRESRATQLVETTLQVTPRQGDWKPNGETNRNQ